MFDGTNLLLFRKRKEWITQKVKKELEKQKKKNTYTYLNLGIGVCKPSLNIPSYWKENHLHIQICLCTLQNIFFWYEQNRTTGISNEDYILIA